VVVRSIESAGADGPLQVFALAAYSFVSGDVVRFLDPLRHRARSKSGTAAISWLLPGNQVAGRNTTVALATIVFLPGSMGRDVSAAENDRQSYLKETPHDRRAHPA
jgi:hypothetical protein